MTPLDFLTHVWPDTGYYCIGTLAPPPTKGVMWHKLFDNIPAAAAYAQTISSTRDVYFATHVLKENRKKEARTQENARACKILFLDIDIDPNKPAKTYATAADAVAALRQFVLDTALPHPMVVSSGGGLHIYWVLDRELDSHGEWLAQAEHLKALALSHGLKIDRTRTTDQSSVLRVPGTWNHKTGTPRPVQVRKLGQGGFTGFDVEVPATLPAAAPDATGLGSNTGQAEFDKPPPTMVSLLKSCAQMQRLARLKGNCSEPEWYWGCVGVVKFTENGESNVHKISSGYPGYSASETDAKIHQWSKPPTLCTKLEEVCGGDLCKACPAYGKGSSPAWIAYLNDNAPPPQPMALVPGVPPVVTAIPNPPLPYRRAKTGGIEVLVEGKEGKTFPVSIYPYDFYPLERSFNSQQETEQQLWQVHPPHAEPKSFVIEASTFVDSKALQIRLANNGIYAPKFPELQNYMSAYIRELQRLNPVTVQHNNLGWIDDHSQFVLPTKILQPKDAPKPVSLSASAANTKTFVGTKGTLARQIELMKFFNPHAYIPNQFFILSSLGAAIFFATGHHGAIVNATGDKGTSKSTALYAASAFWGPPKRYALNGTADGATALARDGRREVLSNLPLCIDEITHIAADVAKTFAMNATQPGGRIRLKQDGSQKALTDNERASMTLTTANISLHALLQTDNAAGGAGSVRVFEIEFAKRHIHKPYEADAFLRGLTDNHGHIGEHFIQTVVSMREKVVNRVIYNMERIGTIANMQEEERFWFAVAASTITAGELAVRLGLVTWSVADIEQWFLNVQLPHMRGIISDEMQGVSPTSVLMDYLEHINGDMIKTSKPHGGNISNVLQTPRGEMLADYDMDAKIIYVLKSGFGDFCKHTKRSRLNVLRELHRIGVVPSMSLQRILGAGTSHAKGRSYCFTVSMAHPDIADAQLPEVVPPKGALTVVTGGKK